MLYIVCVIESDDKRIDALSYRVFDTYSHSLLILNTSLLKHIILNTEIQVINASIHNNEIVVKRWSNGIPTLSENGLKFKKLSPWYIVLCQDSYTFRVVDYEGKLYTFNRKEMRGMIKSGEMANCQQIGDTIQAEDTYSMHKDEEFEKLIDLKYDNFLAKTALLGHKRMSFDYETENNEVRLTKYTGSSQHVILPSFITAIKQNAFTGASIITISLNEGLKVIGTRAFAPKEMYGALREITIPETVEIIGARAFLENPKVVSGDGVLHIDRFKLGSNKTIVLKQSL